MYYNMFPSSGKHGNNISSSVSVFKFLIEFSIKYFGYPTSRYLLPILLVSLSKLEAIILGSAVYL